MAYSSAVSTLIVIQKSAQFWNKRSLAKAHHHAWKMIIKPKLEKKWEEINAAHAEFLSKSFYKEDFRNVTLGLVFQECW